MNPLYANKPRDYGARRAWQLAQRAAGIPIECGREACHTRGSLYVGSGTGTTLYYCAACADEINKWNPGTCQFVMGASTSPPPRTRSNMSPFAALAMMSAFGVGVPLPDDAPGLARPGSIPRPTKAPKPPDDIQAAIMARAEARRERVRARNLKNLEQR